MKMEVNNQLHIDWGRNRDKLLGGKKMQFCLTGGSMGCQVLLWCWPWETKMCLFHLGSQGLQSL